MHGPGGDEVRAALLFLDEIGDLPPQLQPKLLRFIQDHEYEQVGDPVTRRANVRVVTATNINLDAAVKAGKFREDLFYRLNVVELYIPPLRERRPDILPLLLENAISGDLRDPKPQDPCRFHRACIAGSRTAYLARQCA